MVAVDLHRLCRGRDNEDDLSNLDKVDSGAAIGLRVALEDGPFNYSASVKTPVTSTAIS